MLAERGSELLGVNIAFFVVSSFVVVLRCYTRLFISKAFGLDDWLMALAYAFFMAYIICSNAGVRYGTGKHRSDLPHEHYSIAKRYWWLCYIFFGLTMTAAKLSFGWLLLRIVSIPEHTWVICGTSIMVIMLGVVFTFVNIFQCYPVARYWNESLPGHCIAPHIYTSLGYTYSAISVTTDLIFALLPGFVVWRLQIQTRIRWVLVFLMSLGCVASSAVLVRTAYIKLFYSSDFLWATTDIALWSTIEMGLAITAASCTTLRPLARSLGLIDNEYSGESDTESNVELRRPSPSVALGRLSEIDMAGLHTPGRNWRDALDASGNARSQSVSSQATTHFTPGFDGAKSGAAAAAGMYHGHGADGLQLSSVEAEMKRED